VDFNRPSVTVDLGIFTVLDADLKLLLIRRKLAPFQGMWALPGGFVRVGPTSTDQGESVEDAAYRELEEETGLPRSTLYLEQLRTFGAPDRDPRERVITVAWIALVRPDLAPRVHAGSDAADARWHSVRAEIPSLALAFDHTHIIAAAIGHIRDRVDRSSLAFELVPPTFTIAELRAVHEAIQGTAYDRGNFRRRFKRMQTDGVIEVAPGRRLTSTKPATVYRFLGGQPDQA
jgi:8-oxo-dGTP diphosphatase